MQYRIRGISGAVKSIDAIYAPAKDAWGQPCFLISGYRVSLWVDAYMQVTFDCVSPSEIAIVFDTAK